MVSTRRSKIFLDPGHHIIQRLAQNGIDGECDVIGVFHNSCLAVEDRGFGICRRKGVNQTSKDKPREHQDKQYRKQKQNDNDGNDLADVLASGPNSPGHGTIRAAGGSSFCGTGNCLACLNGAFYRVGGGCSGFHSVGKTSLFFFIHLEPVLSAGSGGQLFDD